MSALVDGEHLLTLLGLSVAERNELANLMTRIGALTVKRADGTDDAGAAEVRPLRLLRISACPDAG